MLSKTSRLSGEWREGVLRQAQDRLLLHIAEDLMAGGLEVLAAGDVDPVVAAVVKVLTS